MLKLKKLFLLLLIPSAVFSQNLSLGQGTINQQNYYEEIDIELSNNKIIVPVTIDGKLYKFLLDTGAPNLLSKRVLNEIGTTKTQKINVNDANNNADSLQMVQIPSIKIGNLNVLDNVALVSDLDNHPILKCFKLDGFIGSNFFRNSILKVSLKDKKITITNNVKLLQIKSKPTELKLIGDQKSPYIKISFNNNKKINEDVLVDTGMDGFYEISNRAYTIFSKEKVFAELSRSYGTAGIGLFGNASMKEQIMIKSNVLRINHTSFKNLITMTTDDNNSRIGFDVLRYGDIVIDFINEKFYFEAEKEVTFDKKPLIYSSTVIDNKYVVGFVWDKAYQDKLNVGDEIIRINNYNLNKMDLCEIVNLRNSLRDEPSYEMEIKSKDNKT